MSAENKKGKVTIGKEKNFKTNIILKPSTFPRMSIEDVSKPKGINIVTRCKLPTSRKRRGEGKGEEDYSSLSG